MLPPTVSPPTPLNEAFINQTADDKESRRNSGEKILHGEDNPTLLLEVRDGHLRSQQDSLINGHDSAKQDRGNPSELNTSMSTGEFEAERLMASTGAVSNRATKTLTPPSVKLRRSSSANAELVSSPQRKPLNNKTTTGTPSDFTNVPSRQESIKNELYVDQDLLAARKFIDTEYFWDNKRKIDMVLAYRDDEDPMKTEKRLIYQENLQAEGLEMELEDKSLSSDGKTYFLKIHTPNNVLNRFAEIMSMKLPIKKFVVVSHNIWKDEQPKKSTNWCGLNSTVFDYNTDLIPPEPNNFTALIGRNREDQFVIKERNELFTSAQRSQIVWQILMRIRYTESVNEADRSKAGINRLLNKGVYLAAFPLHDGPYNVDPAQGRSSSIRRMLYLEWARPKRMYKKQPLWLVREYFGDKIGLYFAWLGFYTEMLILPAVIGLLVFIYGLIMVDRDTTYNPSFEICQGNISQTIMCPLCHKLCTYWTLKESCPFSRVTYLFDNPATVFFAIFMSFWATLFLEFWKRRQAIIAWEWDLAHYEDEEDARPEFEISAKSFRLNPVTKELEPFMPIFARMWRLIASSTILVFMLLLVLAALFGVIVYRLVVITLFYRAGSIFWLKSARFVTSLTAATLNLLIIVTMNQVYRKVAVKLTNLENPRTQTEYEDSYTFKMFSFQFVNYYSSLVYIAFFKNRFYTYPGEKNVNGDIIKLTQADTCDPAGCLSELCIQLFIIMIGKQILDNFVEILLPKMTNWWRWRSTRNHVTPDQVHARWEQDFQLQGLTTLSLFEEYLEMVIQYGFITLFVAAFPLAPLFALLNNVVELRLDAYKYLTQARKPLAQRVHDIGAWLGILRGVTYLAVASNALVIAFTSDFIPRLVYWYQHNADGDLTGYVNSSLSVFNTSDFLSEHAPDPKIDNRTFATCRYRGYRNPPDHEKPYELSLDYWHIVGARLAFVVVFEHFVLFLTGAITYFIPDVPGNVKVQLGRERMLAKEAQFELERNRLRMERRLSNNSSPIGSVLSWTRALHRPGSDTKNDDQLVRTSTFVSLH